MEENLYGSKEAADLVQVKESTLRKYALILEEAGYQFHKNSTGQRGFYDRDIVALRRMLEINEHPDMTLKRAAHAVVSSMAQIVETQSDTTDISLQDQFMKRYATDMTELKEVIHNQNEMIERLTRQLAEESAARQEMQRLLIEKIEKGPQPKFSFEDGRIDPIGKMEQSIMERLDKIEQGQKTVADLIEQVEDGAPEEKQSIWKRIFGN